MLVVFKCARGLAAVVAVTAAVMACGSGASSGSSEVDAMMSSSGDETGANDPQLQVPSESCAAAPMVEQGRFAGTLRDRGPDPGLGGVCGGGGPDVFLRVEVPVRADLRVEARGVGFTARVSLAPPGCQKAPMLVCGGSGVAELEDLSEGTVVTLAIGAEEALFAGLSGVAVKEGEPDPLGFTVDVGMRRVLAAGEVCMPAARGRCGAGTLCLPVSDTDADTDMDGDSSMWTCTPLVGNGCIDPEEVAVDLVDGVGSVSIDPDQPHSDVHRHSCTGAGMRERVLRLVMPADLGPQDSLELRVGGPDVGLVGLAVRAPGCLASDELACMAPRPYGARVVIAAPDQLRQAGVAPYLFVELPEPGVLGEPVLVLLRKVQRAPPVSAGN
ncbi:MAG: hypothetical protein H0T76_24890 [Nannocystis sp.]|nr:hypothetical protein [Nannocystis sp.]MBA3549729.1 hypothetical protein [Nannocystis sp.]